MGTYRQAQVLLVRRYTLFVHNFSKPDTRPQPLASCGHASGLRILWMHPCFHKNHILNNLQLNGMCVTGVVMMYQHYYDNDDYLEIILSLSAYFLFHYHSNKTHYCSSHFMHFYLHTNLLSLYSLLCVNTNKPLTCKELYEIQAHILW